MHENRYRHWPFSATLLAASLICLATTLPTWAQLDSETGGFGDFFGQAGGEPIVTVASHFTQPGPNGQSSLFVTATIKKGWHIYSITQPKGGPVATSIKVELPPGVRLGSFQASPPPEKKKEPLFNNLMVESHHDRVVWSASLEIPPGLDPASLKLQGRVKAQPCDPNTCLPPQDFPFTATLAVGETPVPPPATMPPASPPAAPPSAPPAPSAQSSMAQAQPGAGSMGFNPETLVLEEDEQLRQTSLTIILLTGFLGGLILNLMPCVLPVIGLKILSFVEQSGHSRGHALMLNIWYSLGLISVFLVLASLAVFMGLGWGQLFSYAGFNITLTAVVFVMGLSFLGVWEIPIPGFVGSGKMLEAAEKEGAAGAFTKGIITTILATPCSAPFLGTALAWAVAQPPANTYAVFSAVGLGMASPYLLIGAFPSLIRFLPKPGAWMDTFKQIMGFVLLGTVVYLLTILYGSYVVPTVGFLFGLWAACWWIGRVPVMADLAAKGRAWVQAILFAGIVWILMFSGTKGFLPERLAFSSLQEVMRHRLEGIGWEPYQPTAFQQALNDRKTVLVDFTADWCMTCKTLEALVLHTEPIERALQEGGVVTFVADWTHGDPQVTEMLELLGSKQVPVLAIFPAGRPNQPIVLRGGYTQKTLLEALRKAGPSKS